MSLASASQSRPPALVSRAPTIASSSRPRRAKFSTSRNFVVFPVQLGQAKSPLEAFPFTSYTTIDLKTRHSYDPNLAQDVDEIWVETANYYKQKQSPQHEFIIFSVIGKNGMQNFIALDRNVHTKGSANLISRGGKNGPPAQDYFHVSHYADMESLINHCGNTTSEDLCTHVEQVAFERKAFSFAELVVLASTISEACPSYQLSATNCYWFASLIWECMLDVFRGGVARHNKLTEERGRFRGIKIQGNHSNFQGVVDKYKNDVVEFMKGLRDDAISVVDRRSRRFSALLPDPSEYDEKSSTSSITTAESRRPRTVSTVALGTSASVSRAQVSGPEKDRKSERARATSLCPTSKSQDPTTRLSASMNKDLPSLPPSAPVHSRTHPTDNRKKDARASASDLGFLPTSLPETVKRGSNRYSDIGKSFEEATVVYNQPNRPASYVNPTSKQVQFESSQSRIPDNVRLKVHSLPSHPVSPGGDLNKDRPRSPSLPVGATPTETREASKDSQNSTPESSTEPAPRARTMSGLNRLRRALPKLLLPTVSESGRLDLSVQHYLVIVILLSER
ncbi:hypothetical protein OPQ81_002597 [Rhizoctonia solani]|nr:hypothetical protein OPQ81_002597 [Rhizoctonia solani]